MNSPKEKAKQLVDRFSRVGLQQRDEGVACALIFVDEILSNDNNFMSTNLQKEYWSKVKKEINKL